MSSRGTSPRASTRKPSARLASELETERSRLRSVFQEAPAYVALFQGPDHVYVLSSRLNDQFLGHREVLGRPLREAVPEAVAQGFVALLDAVYATGEPFIGKEVEIRIRQPDGSQRRVFNNFVYQAIRDGEGRIDGVAIFGFDVTEQVLARRRLEELAADNARLYQEAQKAIRIRDDFLSVASHELKTPLTALNLKLQALERELKGQPDTAFRQKALASVEVGRRQVRKLSELVGDLLDVSRIGSGRLALTREPVDLSALVRDVLARFEPMAAQAGSRLDTDITPGVVGHWDALRLEQVVMNLVDNAIKYGAGKPVHVQLDSEGREARLRVQDQGIGIAPADLPRIFQRFERAVSDRHYGGLGLGLYITQSIVEAMDGHIHVWSESGHGACFTVSLPP
jgi:signal transduction histidine kinase